ncbi:lipoprotein LpqH [Nocardia callitridis]|uniref:Lipoprotein LpqH n=1 Tax=Nocardia callitridis TaxID=648753 RepID=A0ABP9JYC4_9NOCA
MNTKSVTAAVTASAAALALLLTGCGDNSEDAAADTATAATAEPQGGVSSRSSASVDGKLIEAKFETTCAEQGDNLALALVDQDNPTYGTLSVSASVTGADTVQAVAFAGSKGGADSTPFALGFGSGMPGGSATLSKDGNTYRVSGEGVGGVDLGNPMAGPSTSTFEVTFDCSTVVGG